jgi:hypothetical protein
VDHIFSHCVNYTPLSADAVPFWLHMLVHLASCG